MKKFIAVVLIACVIMTSLTGCQTTTKHVGGNMTLELEPNQNKVENIKPFEEEKMFGKNKIENKIENSIPESVYGIEMDNGEIHYVDAKTYGHIKVLEKKNSELMQELAAIKPIVATGKLKPAISNHCIDCVYCIRSTWNKSIVSCCKDNVCADYKNEGGVEWNIFLLG